MKYTSNSSPQLKPLSVSIHDAVRLTSIGRSRIYELIGTGALPSTSVGRRRVIPYAALEKLISDGIQIVSDNELAIVVQRDASDLGFDVLITPRSPISGLNREFTSYRKARGCADGVAAVTGWKLIDTVEINQ